MDLVANSNFFIYAQLLDRFYNRGRGRTLLSMNWTELKVTLTFHSCSILVFFLILLLLQGQAGEVGTLKQSNDLSDIGEHWPEKMLSHWQVLPRVLGFCPVSVILSRCPPRLHLETSLISKTSGQTKQWFISVPVNDENKNAVQDICSSLKG